MPLAGDFVAASDWGDLSDDSSQKPLVRLIQSVAQSIANNTVTAVTYSGTDSIDTHNYHDPAVNNTRVTPTKAGYYRCTSTYWSAGSNTLTFIETAVRKNGSAQIGPVGRLGGGGTNNSAAVATSGTCSVSSTCITDINGSGDYIEHVIRQTQSTGTAAVNTNISGSFSTHLEIEFLRDL